MTTNNRMILWTVLAIALVLGGGLWYATSGASFLKPGSSTTTLPAHSPYTEHGQYYAIAANFPTSTPLASTVSSAALSTMHDWISEQIVQFKKDTGVANLTPTKAQKLGMTNGRKYTLNIVYLEGSSAHTYSYIFTMYEDTGDAHGNTFFKTFTFDASTGKLLVLSDVFTGNYLPALSLLVRQKLAQNLGNFSNATILKEGTMPDAKNFQDWFFDNHDFVLLFPPYQVAAYAAGPQTVRIPTSDLQGNLAPTYP